MTVEFKQLEYETLDGAIVELKKTTKPSTWLLTVNSYSHVLCKKDLECLSVLFARMLE